MRLGRIGYINCYPIYGAMDRGVVPPPADLVTATPAELNDLLAELTPVQLPEAVAIAPPELRDLPPLLQNYVAAMVEQASGERRVPTPRWVREVPPLEEPYFATPLRSLRLHLLRAAPVPFKRRNIFVDSAVGARV